MVVFPAPLWPRSPEYLPRVHLQGEPVHRGHVPNHRISPSATIVFPSRIRPLLLSSVSISSGLTPPPRSASAERTREVQL